MCLCVSDDRPKTNMEDLGAPSGQHQGGGVALWKEKPGLKIPGRQGERQGRRRDEEQAKEEEEEERGKQSSRYTEQRGFSVCHIRTVGSVWNLGSFLCYFQSLACRQAPQAPVTKYGPAATSLFKQTKMFLYMQLVVTDKWLTSNR